MDIGVDRPRSEDIGVKRGDLNHEFHELHEKAKILSLSKN